MTLSRLSHVRKTKIIAPITRTLAVKGTKRLLLSATAVASLHLILFGANRLGVGAIDPTGTGRQVTVCWPEDDDSCADLDAIVEVDHILVGQADAAR